MHKLTNQLQDNSSLIILTRNMTLSAGYTPQYPWQNIKCRFYLPLTNPVV